MRFSRAETGDAEAISTLVLKTCKRYLFESTSREGRQTLHALYEPASIRQRIEAGDRYVVAHRGEELVGAAAMRLDDRYVYLLFVAGNYHGQSLGRQLVERLVAGAGDVRHVELKSSMYAVDFYKRLGFVATGPVLRTKGLECLPMKLVL